MIKSRQNKGFTLLEILLVIAAIGILAAIVLVAINPNRQLAQARNLVRQADINTIQKALEQYLIDNGRYPTGIDTTYKEICSTGSNSANQGTVGSNCIDLREMVPDYLASIPVNPTVSIQSGYYVWINDINNKVAVLAGKGENGKVIGINHLKENIVTDGLVLHLDAGNLASYPGTGNTWFDLSGNGNNGTLINGVGYNSANGGSLVFDGVDDYSAISYTQTNVISYSIEAWINTSGTSKLQAIVNNRGGGGGKSLTLGLTSPGGGPTSTPGYLMFALDTDGIGVGPYLTGKTFNDGNWHQIVGTLDMPSGVTLNGSSAPSYMSLYADGDPITSISYWAAGGITSPFTGGGSTFVGRHAPWGEARFPGKIGSIKIYNRALTPEEIQQNFNATRGRFGL
jgi:prepilin-type N-terminal cleavage/methylation domain-containing protein